MSSDYECPIDAWNIDIHNQQFGPLYLTEFDYDSNYDTVSITLDFKCDKDDNQHNHIWILQELIKIGVEITTEAIVSIAQQLSFICQIDPPLQSIVDN